MRHRLVFLLLVTVAPACVASVASEERGTAQETNATHGSLGGRICSWNIRRLGHRFDQLEKNLEATAQVIKDHCDVVAVQEVMQASGDDAVPGYTGLLAALGFAWDGVRTDQPRPDTSSANSERYAWFFRKSVASICPDFGPPRYIPDDEDAFLREPAWTCVKVRDHAKELVIGTYHAVFGSPADRRREVGQLDDDRDLDGKKDDIIRTLRDSRPGADVVLVGDFNLSIAELAEVLPTYKDMTTGEGSTINEDDEVANQYDHVLVAPDEPILSELEPAEVLDVRDYAAPGDSYYQTISDHLPIRFVLRPPH